MHEEAEEHQIERKRKENLPLAGDHSPAAQCLERNSELE